MNNKKIRGFEIAKGWENKNINLPIRKTAKSAGYDVESPAPCSQGTSSEPAFGIQRVLWLQTFLKDQ